MPAGWSDHVSPFVLEALQGDGKGCPPPVTPEDLPIDFMVLTPAFNRGLLIAGLGISLAGFGGEQAAQARNHRSLRGSVSLMGKPVANASITHWTKQGGT